MKNLVENGIIKHSTIDEQIKKISQYKEKGSSMHLKKFIKRKEMLF